MAMIVEVLLLFAKKEKNNEERKERVG